MGRGNLIKKQQAKLERKKLERLRADAQYRQRLEEGYDLYQWPRHSSGVLDVMAYPYDESFRGFCLRGDLCYLGASLHKTPVNDRGRPVLVRKRKEVKLHVGDDLWTGEEAEVLQLQRDTELVDMTR